MSDGGSLTENGDPNLDDGETKDDRGARFVEPGTTERRRLYALRHLVERVTVVDGSSPFFSVLREETDQVERTLALVWTAVSTGAAVIALATTLVVDAPLGFPLFVLSLFSAAVFFTLRALTARGRGILLLRAVMPLFEISMPTVVFVVLAQTQGQGYAIGSWVPAQLSILLIALSVIRLRPIIPFLLGVVAALQLSVAYVLLIDADRFIGTELELLASARMQLVRATSLVVEGAGFTWIILMVKRRLAVVAREVRARDLFGKYRLGREIAQGGMGTVVEATYCPEGGFARRVAVKRIHPHLAREPRFVESFRDEASLSARLVHPNIVSVFDFGRVEDTYFYAMELVDGMNVGELMRRCRKAEMPVPANIVHAIGGAILEALHHAHAVARDDAGSVMRVVHRDLSPSNVLVSFSGEVKLSDFGIAKALKDQDAHVTTHVVGKLGYMAPEQALGEPIDVRADLFATGVILFELLTLTPLFTRGSAATTLRALLDEPIPDLDPRRDDVGDAVAALLHRAITRDPGARFASARAMKEALDDAFETHDASTVARTRARASVEDIHAFLAALLTHATSDAVTNDDPFTDVDPLASTQDRSEVAATAPLRPRAD